MQVPRNILWIYFSLLLGNGNDCKNDKNSELGTVNGSASPNWVGNYVRSRAIPTLVGDASQWKEYRFRKNNKGCLHQMQKTQSTTEPSRFCSITHPQSCRNCTAETQCSVWSQRETDFRWGQKCKGPGWQRCVTLGGAGGGKGLERVCWRPKSQVPCVHYTFGEALNLGNWGLFSPNCWPA